ncbi:MAG: hypothetical protein H6Q49_1981 [Deltaproteobacteria bacterium]|jgi:hypothetical protein|nr:hypothetical protein [Deltaproteobacteria bacterium]
MGNDKSAERKNAKGEDMKVGYLTGPITGFILIVIGVLVSFTGIGLIIGIPLILCGIAYPFIGRSLIKGPCPYCGSEVRAFGFKTWITCLACRELIVIRDKKFFRAE